MDASPLFVNDKGFDINTDGGDELSRKEEYEKTTEEILAPILAECGFECVDVEYIKEAGNWYLRAYIDKPGGITIDDCETVSRRLSDALDKKDYIEDSYILEVSSPGLGRPLRKDKDLKRNIGEEVEVHTYKPVDGQKEFAGILKTYDTATITITIESGNELKLNRKEISLIRLAFDF